MAELSMRTVDVFQYMQALCQSYRVPMPQLICQGVPLGGDPRYGTFIFPTRYAPAWLLYHEFLHTLGYSEAEIRRMGYAQQRDGGRYP